MTGSLFLRRATAHDVERIAALHAESWRRNYRGAFADAFLDADVLAERLAVWTERLGPPSPSPPPAPHCTIVAERGNELVGFAHTVFDEDPTWGALLDNLHVDHSVAGQGVGTQLMRATASAVLAEGSSPRLYLWVLEQNRRAQRFYEARGATYVEREPFEPPGGGVAVGLRYAWADVSVLLTSS